MRKVGEGNTRPDNEELRSSKVKRLVEVSGIDGEQSSDEPQWPEGQLLTK